MDSGSAMGDVLEREVSRGFFSRLSNLEYLDVRGGSGTNADSVGLQFLSLYGLPHVTQIPPLGALLNLDRAEIGSMKGLEGISGLLEAPALTELLFSQKVGVTQADAASIATHHTIKKFAWFAEDVPERVYVPFVERVGKPSAGFDWWERNTRQPQ